MTQKKIHIYIDESGDIGIKFEKATSEFFVISLLCIENKNLPYLESFLCNTKDILNIKQKEFKFSQTTYIKKISFYKKIKDLDFLAHVFIYKKKVHKNFGWFLLNAFTYNDVTDIQSVRIIIDDLDKNKITKNDIKILRYTFKGIKVKITRLE